MIFFFRKKMDICRFIKCCRKIVGVTMNYRQRYVDQGLVEPFEPVIFLKAPTSLIAEKGPIMIPRGFRVYYEIELGIVIRKCCKDVEPCRADDYIGAYCLALDLTAINMLRRARYVGHPWALAKSFDTACAVSKFLTPCQIEDPKNVQLWLSIDGRLRANGSTCDMLFPPDVLISYISKNMTLEPYDLILTGTPCTDEILPGQKIIAGIGKILDMEFDVCGCV